MRNNCRSWFPMTRIVPYLTILTLLLAAPQAWPFQCDLSAYRETKGLTAAVDDDSLRVQWEGERGDELRAVFSVESGRPVVRELAARSHGRPWLTLGRNLIPEFSTISGIRRTNHGLPHDQRWHVFWDAPLEIPGAGSAANLPRKPEEIRRATATFQVSGCSVRTAGSRLEVSFPGLSMGIFSGSLQYTVYRGSNLLRQEAIAKTEEPSVAYIYRGGLRGFSVGELSRVVWRDPSGFHQKYEFGGAPNQDPVTVRARNRLLLGEGDSRSLAVFPPPHQFFFARELEVNSGYVWYRKDADNSFSIGVRQAENQEGYNPIWNEQVYALFNAPPGTWQRMALYFYLSPADASSTRDHVMAYTHGDRYKPLAGYQTMVTHFHAAFSTGLAESGSLDADPPAWIHLMRAMGVNIALIDDFHGDGHPRDPGPLRLKELANYYAACRRHSDLDFLILPGEEANAHLGGHYNIIFPKPVYWTHVRQEGQPLVEEHRQYGTVYHTGSAEDMLEMMKRENALVWQTHPRTKGSTGYPDKIKDTDHFRSDRWLGGAFKAMGVDLSEKRLCERRCFDVLDDMNNWGRPKYLVGEVDTYKKFTDYDLYGDFNVNYVQVGRLPLSDDWSDITQALREGRFFVTTGEVLITDYSVEQTGVTAEVEWTFPLEFVEVVWGDGETTKRKTVSATDKPPFDSHRFDIAVDLREQKWVRFAAWDSAGNGAFTQPVHLR